MKILERTQIQIAVVGENHMQWRNYIGAGGAIAVPSFWLCTPTLAWCNKKCHYDWI